METWQAIFLGIVQGLAEFLPISSSGHLLMLQDAMNIKLSHSQQVSFDIALHAGTLVALVGYFRRDLWNLLTAWLGTVRLLSFGERGSDGRMAWLIILGTFPAILAVKLFKPQIDAAEQNSIGIAIALILVSFVFVIADKLQGKRDITTLGPGSAILVGIGQALALIPGVSRSGASISTGMILGFDRAAAARFSFLLSAPVVIAAVLQDLPDAIKHASDSHTFFMNVIVGFIAAAISGWLAVSFLLKFLRDHKLSWFLWYRIPAGIAFLIWFSTNG